MAVSCPTMEYLELFGQVRRRPGMYVGSESFDSVSAWVDGFDMGRSGGVLVGFKEWLTVRADGGNNLAWTALVRLLAGGDPDTWTSLENRKAVDLMFALIEAFARERAKRGLRAVLHDYQRWLWKQSWYDAKRPDWIAPPRSRAKPGKRRRPTVQASRPRPRR